MVIGIVALALAGWLGFTALMTTVDCSLLHVHGPCVSNSTAQKEPQQTLGFQANPSER